ncbi:MAG: biotin-dependent carboxyltransferase family protein [Acidimicrobiales bacterium]
MTEARLRVDRVGPHVSFQDAGRFRQMRFGVPASGPMDRLSHAAANVVLGNERNATAIEVSVAGLTLTCDLGPVAVAVVGGEFVVRHRAGGRHHQHEVDSWTVVGLRTGDELSIHAGTSGSWTYAAFAGHLEAPAWLGHTATHSISGLGGGQLGVGQILTVAGPRLDARRLGPVPQPDLSAPRGQARVVMGPQDHHFQPSAVTTFESAEYRLSDAYDRMGVRLIGPPLELRDSLSIPSEPIVRGSIQVAGDGVPTLLLADHQTTGGYPKIATVIASDLDEVAQRRPGDAISFTPVTPGEAIDIARRRAADVATYLERLAGPGRTLTHRLMHENLIGSVPTPDDE